MRSRPRSLLWVAALALACEAQAFLPGALAGRWVSDDPRYAGRALTLSASYLEFAGEQSSETFEVRGVEALANSDGSTTYTVSYGAKGEGDMQLRLRLTPGSPATLRLGNRPERWQLAPRDWGTR
jgi:hypothetical protein